MSHRADVPSTSELKEVLDKVGFTESEIVRLAYLHAKVNLTRFAKDMVILSQLLPDGSKKASLEEIAFNAFDDLETLETFFVD